MTLHPSLFCFTKNQRRGGLGNADQVGLPQAVQLLNVLLRQCGNRPVRQRDQHRVIQAEGKTDLAFRQITESFKLDVVKEITAQGVAVTQVGLRLTKGHRAQRILIIVV
ncbi:Uncharacterised protein [Klebsiella pneumoniae]|nr:Uncharacterised protein [Klebsiella pneumoniae]